MVLSQEPVASVVLPAVKDTPSTQPLCPCNVPRWLPLCVFHRDAVQSAEPTHRSLPVGLCQEREVRGFLWAPFNILRVSRLLKSHIRTSLSQEPEASSEPSGLKLKQETFHLWPSCPAEFFFK